MSKINSPLMIKRGQPLPLGVNRTPDGINFALFARSASHVVLVLDLLAQSPEQSERIEITLTPEEHRTGDVWHLLLETPVKQFTYGYRVFGSHSDPAYCFQPDRILIDPYCQALAARPWGEQSRYGETPSCCLINHDFDWQDDRPLKTPLTETIIYELHVRSFTRSEQQMGKTAGTYAGIVEKIPYLKELGITAVELMPVTEFDENDTVFFDPATGQRLKNLWGYNPVSFFALKSGYASNPADHINEFKAMVKALHTAGIEVILDIVYNHTGEGDYDGTTSSFRAIENPVYYLLSQEDRSYLNFSGCGNTMNCNHPIVRSLIRDSLRYWVMEMHIDGFRFDLASILGRDQEGEVLPNPPMIELIAEDPVLRDTKIIAEAWDAAGLYQVGSFSSDERWGEWNGRFRDDIRSFMAGHSGMVTRLATRMAGSSDLYQSSRGPLSSINFITSHDGFTLYDLVSYNTKHNLRNGEQNRDGDSHNISWNSGHEGSPAPHAVERLRRRRMRSMLTIVILSQGVPMLTSGDEFGRTQSGNNNAWCQDNTISWLDWTLVERNSELHRFVKILVRLRKNHQVFRREEFFMPSGDTGTNEEISWQYLHPGEQNWSTDCHGLGALLHGSRNNQPRDDDFFLMINGSRELELTFTLPEVPTNHDNRKWHLIIDTSAFSPLDADLSGRPLDSGQSKLTVPPFSVMVLQSKPPVRITASS